MSSSRPEPVLDAAKIAGAVSGAVTGIGGVMVLVGWWTTDDVKSWAVAAGGAVTGIGALIAAVLPFITAIGARAQVTPLADPVGVDGNVLAPAVRPTSPTRPPVPTSRPVPPVVAPAKTRTAPAAVEVDRSPLPIELEARAAASAQTTEGSRSATA